jgi:uncharacterized RDD family membrane protein YckC
MPDGVDEISAPITAGRENRLFERAKTRICMNRYRVFLKRSAAYLLDIVLIFLILAPLGLLVQSLLGIQPESGFEIWQATLLNFSVPVWLYFIICDQSAGGATLGKRLLNIRVADQAYPQRSPVPGKAIIRTLMKLLPWEIIHVSGFALAGDLSSFSMLPAVGISIGNILTIAYLATALATRGRYSVHDFVAKTLVEERIK